MSEFKPGDMVECVNDNHNVPNTVHNPLVRGGIYTVEAVGTVPGVFLTGRGTHNCVWLVEQKNGPEGPYAAARFRLVRTTNISIFRKIVKEAMETGKVTA